MKFKPGKSFLLLFLILLLASCQVGRFMVYNLADIRDHKKFPAREIHRQGEVFQFHPTDRFKVPDTVTVGKDRRMPFMRFLDESGTVALLIIQRDSMLFEHYAKGYDAGSTVPSFSMAKAVVSLLIGCAIEDGLIKSVDQPVTDYVPELEKNGFANVTIRHLLQMTSGLDFKESYFNPFGDAASFYYGRRLRKKMGRMKLDTAPGTQFDYVSGNTQLLALVLERSIGGQSISAYLEKKLWQPMGMEFDASWSIDRTKGGMEKAFCCLNACARDYARIGRLMSRKGEWNGTQLVPAAWIEESTHPDTADGGVAYYKYQWWISGDQKSFMAIGILGQYIYVHPEKDLVIVRLGKKEGKPEWWRILPSMALSF